MLKTVLLSSLHKVFPGHCPGDKAVQGLSAFQNEPLSFQLAFRITENLPKSLLLYARVESRLELCSYYVGYVPVVHTDTEKLESVPAPGLFGDMLLPKKINPPIAEESFPWDRRRFEQGEEITLNAANDSWQSLWFCVNERQEMLPSGEYPVTIRLFGSASGDCLSEDTFTVTVIPAVLPKQKLVYTNWFHYDCLSDYYGEPVFTDRFFIIMRSFVEAAVKNGMNMLLMPAFTPPLDTPENSCRKTVQLVKVFRTAGGYAFDFSLMKRYLDICRKAGMEYFEHSHLFTQWGAKAAPKIMAEEDGKETVLFGWQTDASGSEYKEFLQAYIPAVLSFLKEEKLEKKVLFHISDEPVKGNADSYWKAVQTVGSLLNGCWTGDALSDYLFYEKGFVKTPIVATHTIDTFIGRCDDMWAYYTGGQLENGLSNRVLVVPSERNRMIGIQLYYFRIRGFLHWGYNYYYDMLSHGLFDPKTNPCGYNNHAGTSYCVYPGRKGEAIQSVRQKVFYEAVNDMRALEAAEDLCGRAILEELIHRHFGNLTFHTCPESPEALLAFRQEVNRLVMEYAVK